MGGVVLTRVKWELVREEVRRAVRGLLARQRGAACALTPRKVARWMGVRRAVDLAQVAAVLREVDYVDGWVAVHVRASSDCAVRVLFVRDYMLSEFFKAYGGRFLVAEPRDWAGGYNGYLLDTPLVRWALYLNYGEPGLTAREIVDGEVV